VALGAYHVYVGTNGAQPDWYLGWLIGALRMMPNLEIHVFGHTLLPNPFFGGVLFPSVVFMLLYAVPWIDRRFISREAAPHHLLDRPRDNPLRTALGAAGSRRSRSCSQRARQTVSSFSSASATKARSGSSGALSWRCPSCFCAHPADLHGAAQHRAPSAAGLERARAGA